MTSLFHKLLGYLVKMTFLDIFVSACIAILCKRIHVTIVQYTSYYEAISVRITICI